MISRRAVLGASATAAGLGIAGVAARAGVLDDGLRAIGVRPHTEPDPHDVALLAEAAQGQRELLALVDQIAGELGDSELSDIRRILGEQLAAVSNDTESPASPYPTVAPSPLPSGDDSTLAALAARVDTVAASRADGAVSAGSVAVAKVLASMAAGLDQVAVTARGIA